MTDADSSTNIFFHQDIAGLFHVNCFHQEILGYGPLQSFALQSPELCLIDQDSEEQSSEKVPAITWNLLMKKVAIKRRHICLYMDMATTRPNRPSGPIW